MTSKRIYRNELPIEVVKEEFLKNKGIQFDPKLVDVFVNILDNDYSKIEEIQQKYINDVVSVN